MSSELEQQLQALQAENQNLRQQLEQKSRVAARALASYQQRALHMEIIRQQNDDLDRLAASLTEAKQLAEDQVRQVEATAQQLSLANAVLEREIAERKHAEEDLLKFKLGIERSNDAIFLTDPDGVITYVNSAFEKVYGFTPDEAIGQTPRILKSGLIPQEGYEHFWGTLLAKGTVAGEIINKAKDGQVIYVTGNNNPILDDQENIIGFLAMHHDITAQKQAEEALRASEVRNRNLLQAIPDMIIRYRSDGTYLDIKPSKEFRAFRDPADLVGRNLFDVVPSDVAQKRMHYIQLALQTGQIQTYEHSFNREDQTKFEEISVVPSGMADEVFVLIRDITERKQAEERLRENEQRYQQILDAIPELILAKGPKSRILWANKAFRDYYGMTNEQLQEMIDAPFNEPDYTQQYIKDDAYVFDSGQMLDIPEEFVTRYDGQVNLFHTIKSPIRNVEGRVIMTVGVSRDIGERKQNQEALTKRAAELETVARVSAAASTILEADKLLQEVVDLTKNSFNLYHAHVYLLNQVGDTLVLAAGAGEVGRRMASAGWSIPLKRERSLVAQAARTRRGVTANDVRKEPDFLPNPLLPETRAEMAIPIIVGEQLLGVLDAQADVVGRFTEEDVRIKTILAGQIGVALQNAHSFAEQQQTQMLLQERVKELNCLNDIGRELVESPLIPELLEWVTRRIPPAMLYPELCQVAIEYDGQFYGQVSAIELPCQMTNALRISGEVMGRIYIAYTEKREFMNEESALLGGIASRLSGYIESRRLLEQVQDALALQEHLSIELDSQRRTLQAVLDNIPAGVFVVEAPSGRPLITNTQAVQLLGKGILPDAAKDELAEVYAAYRYGSDELYPSTQMPLVRGMFGENATIDDMEVRRPDGTKVLLQVFGAPIRDAQGGISASVAIFQDITERKQAEVAIKESEERFRIIAEAAPIPILISSISDGLILYGNEQLGRTFGLVVASLIGKQTPDFYYNPADRAALLATLKRDGQLNDYELHVKKADGTPFWVLMSMRSLVFAGQPALLAVFYDITERKQAEEALHRSREQLSEALKTAQLAYWEFDVASQTFTFNDQFYSLLHTTAEQEGGYVMPAMHYAQKFVHPDDAYMVGVEIQRALETNDPNYSTQLEHRIIRADGSEGYVVVRFRVIKDEQGRTVKTIGANQDITELKRAEEALRENETRLSEALAIAQLGNWEFDVASQTFTFNDQFYSLLHTTAEQEGGYVMPAMHYAQKFVHPDDAYMVGVAIQEALKMTDPNYSTQLEHRVIRADGSEGYVIVRSRVIKDEQGQTIGTIGANQDITESKQAELERERLLAEVESAYRQYVRQEWQQFLGVQAEGWRIEHQQPGLSKEESRETLEEIKNEVIRNGQLRIVNGCKDNGYETEAAVVTPLALRGQVIGALALQDVDSGRRWTDEEIALVETVSEQLTLTLENLRLFEDTQRSAWRDQVVSETTAKVWSSAEIEEVLKTTVAQLGDKLRASEVVIRLGTEEQLDN